jgi:5-methylthioadenosine/S-adenosylhomocysteine deaminase
VHDRHTLPFVPASADPVLQLVWGADGRTVRWVTVAGSVVVDDGLVTTIDLAALAAEAAERSRAIMARAGVTPRPRW